MQRPFFQLVLGLCELRVKRELLELSSVYICTTDIIEKFITEYSVPQNWKWRVGKTLSWIFAKSPLPSRVCEKSPPPLIYCVQRVSLARLTSTNHTYPYKKLDEFSKGHDKPLHEAVAKQSDYMTSM